MRIQIHGEKGGENSKLIPPPNSIKIFWSLQKPLKLCRPLHHSVHLLLSHFPRYHQFLVSLPRATHALPHNPYTAPGCWFHSGFACALDINISDLWAKYITPLMSKFWPGSCWEATGRKLELSAVLQPHSTTMPALKSWQKLWPWKLLQKRIYSLGRQLEQRFVRRETGKQREEKWQPNTEDISNIFRARCAKMDLHLKKGMARGPWLTECKILW